MLAWRLCGLPSALKVRELPRTTAVLTLAQALGLRPVYGSTNKKHNIHFLVFEMPVVLYTETSELLSGGINAPYFTTPDFAAK